MILVFEIGHKIKKKSRVIERTQRENKKLFFKNKNTCAFTLLILQMDPFLTQIAKSLKLEWIFLSMEFTTSNNPMERC